MHVLLVMVESFSCVVRLLNTTHERRNEGLRRDTGAMRIYLLIYFSLNRICVRVFMHFFVWNSSAVQCVL